MSTSPQPIQSQSPKWAVQAPDGKVIQFPDEFTDADVTREMTKMYPLRDSEATQVANRPGQTAPQTTQMKQTGAFGEQVAPLTAKQQQAKGNYESANLKPIGETLGSMGLAALSPVIKGAGIAKNILPFLGRVAGSGVGMGTGALAAGAGPQEAKSAAEAGAIAQPVAEGLSASLPWLSGKLKNMATTQYEKALAPTTLQNKAITKKIVPGMIQQGVRGNLGSIAERAGQEASDLNPQLDAAYAATPGTAGAGAGPKIIQDLENLKGQYQVGGIPANDTAINAINGVQDVVKRFGNDIDPGSMRALKSIFDDPVAKAGGFSGADLSTRYALKAQEQAANSIRGIMAQGSPDVAALNKQINFWLNVQRVTKASADRQTGQAGGLLKVLSPLAGAAGLGFGVATHSASGGVEAAAAAELAALAANAMRSPAWRTTSSVMKSRLANALATGNVGEATAFLGRLAAVATQGGSKSQTQSGPPTQ